MHADQIGRDEAADQWFRAVVAELGDRVLVEEWVERLPPGYRERTLPADAAADIEMAASLLGEAASGAAGGAADPRPPSGAPPSERVDEAATPGPDGVPAASAGRSADRLGADHRLSVRPGTEGGSETFRLRRIGVQAVELTGVLPMLESFGLAVTDAVPFTLTPLPGRPGTEIHVDDFGLRVVGAASFDLVSDGGRLVAALEATAGRRADVDGLNRLVIAAGLDWRQVVVLRAYRRYRMQCAPAWTDVEMDDALAAFPGVASALIEYFESCFAPTAETPTERATQRTAARDGVLERLGAVPHLQQDQMLRGFLGLVDATLRTNWYRRDADGRPRRTIALKLNSVIVPELPAPRPHVETFVHGPAVEGVHLRNGPIARGGIRWSDRPLDFRTEVLGLAEAQTKKNAIIVPTGAKGGFVVRSGSVDPGAVLDAYRDFISGLLDITDTVVEGTVRHPDGVVAADSDDPYLVVAADKGTATFSDEANALSEAYRFWLGDAFASGGSHGYDHKVMGITARGAWVAVRRHFRHLGIDVQREPVRVAGIGDMSGDVFGNGMLQSRALKLVAAFDHRHIFVDPDPDPEKAYEARARLFAMGRSSWADYDESALSAGGGVWSRDAKEITLSPEARASLGLSETTVRPPELISAILTAPVDLLWFGGIGTYVKAPDESDSVVGDHTNDGVRVTADRVRARVIAEGGNLGVTQRGRIRYSRRGGRINTDFIDNAAGVATSDREVNLKILLGLAAEAGRLAEGERDALLAAATDDVAAEVLRQVDHSVAALDRSMPDSAPALDSYVALIERLEKVGLVDRGVESLPDDEEVAARRAAGAGLIRPELAVLLAFAKSDLVASIESSTLADDPALLDAVTPYFPSAIVERAGDLITRHRLYPQLVATDVAGEMVDRLGVVWAHETAAELGRDLADVAGAFWAARQVLDGGSLWSRLEQAADDIDSDAEAALNDAVAEAVTTLARAYLRRPGPVVPSALLAADVALVDRLPVEVDAAELSRTPRVPPELAAACAAAKRSAQVGEVGPVVAATGRSASDVAAAFAVFERSGPISKARRLLASVPPRGRWAAWQARSVDDDLADLRRRAATQALGAAPGAVATPAGAVATPALEGGAPASHRGPVGADAAMSDWLAERDEAFGRAAGLLDAVTPGADDSLLVVSLAVRILAGG
ncbi:NAD-glutamate dehydrogenase [Acidiferrimicrobium sp. IK]|uniref:NAD-glutamate dehydrogenase n=1 Tax=Acidiferrimicrobium sp. IK TaxID=2871700 RepID=UPI0021CB6575|nr:NAD-glutamate dehydrogenase [Acidiferrimicrobium sp. IK]MCU4185419.1 NAD-glutamate dehydrogenase [Acidiferrimicrobium sp. IK]